MGSHGILTGNQLHPVAGGEDESFLNARKFKEKARGLRQVRRRNRQPLAQLDGSRFVIHAKYDNLHGLVNLCTELNWLAAQTLSTTRKAKLDR